MQKHKLRSGVVGAAAIGAAALSATLVVGAGVASAASRPTPPEGRRRSHRTSTTETWRESGTRVPTPRSS